MPPVTRTDLKEQSGPDFCLIPNLDGLLKSIFNFVEITVMKFNILL